jgi:hypothetical protein
MLTTVATILGVVIGVALLVVTFVAGLARAAERAYRKLPCPQDDLSHKTEVDRHRDRRPDTPYYT